MKTGRCSVYHKTADGTELYCYPSKFPADSVRVNNSGEKNYRGNLTMRKLAFSMNSHKNDAAPFSMQAFLHRGEFSLRPRPYGNLTQSNDQFQIENHFYPNYQVHEPCQVLRNAKPLRENWRPSAVFLDSVHRGSLNEVVCVTKPNNLNLSSTKLQTCNDHMPQHFIQSDKFPQLSSFVSCNHPTSRNNTIDSSFFSNSKRKLAYTPYRKETTHSYFEKHSQALLNRSNSKSIYFEGEKHRTTAKKHSACKSQPCCCNPIDAIDRIYRTASDVAGSSTKITSSSSFSGIPQRPLNEPVSPSKSLASRTFENSVPMVNQMKEVTSSSNYEKDACYPLTKNSATSLNLQPHTYELFSSVKDALFDCPELKQKPGMPVEEVATHPTVLPSSSKSEASSNLVDKIDSEAFSGSNPEKEILLDSNTGISQKFPEAKLCCDANSNDYSSNPTSISNTNTRDNSGSTRETESNESDLHYVMSAESDATKYEEQNLKTKDENLLAISKKMEVCRNKAFDNFVQKVATPHMPPWKDEKCEEFALSADHFKLTPKCGDGDAVNIETRKTPSKLLTQIMVVNTKQAKGEKALVNTCVRKLGWQRHDATFSKGTIIWLGGTIADHEYLRFSRCMQTVNRFPGLWDYTKKRMLSSLMGLYQELFPKDYNFLPASWVLPEDYGEIESLLHKNNRKVYIIKPDGGAMGHGLQLVTRISDIDASIIKGSGRYIVQKYIPNPCLLNKRKFDFRIYGLLTNVMGQPQGYISKVGMVRFCTEEYEAPTRKNILNPFMHLTNYSINKDNYEKYVRAKDVHDKTNTKRLLEDVLEDLQKEGIDTNSVWLQIKYITAKTMICLNPWLNLRYRRIFQPKVPAISSCFQIMGLDILLDAKGKAWLLEVNANPSLRIDYFDSKYMGVDIQLESYLDRYIKEPVLSEALQIVRKTLVEPRFSKFSIQERVRNKAETKQRPESTLNSNLATKFKKPLKPQSTLNNRDSNCKNNLKKKELNNERAPLSQSILNKPSRPVGKKATGNLMDDVALASKKKKNVDTCKPESTKKDRNQNNFLKRSSSLPCLHRRSDYNKENTSGRYQSCTDQDTKMSNSGNEEENPAVLNLRALTFPINYLDAQTSTKSYDTDLKWRNEDGIKIDQEWYGNELSFKRNVYDSVEKQENLRFNAHTEAESAKLSTRSLLPFEISYNSATQKQDKSLAEKSNKSLVEQLIVPCNATEAALAVSGDPESSKLQKPETGDIEKDQEIDKSDGALEAEFKNDEGVGDKNHSAEILEKDSKQKASELQGEATVNNDFSQGISQEITSLSDLEERREWILKYMERLNVLGLRFILNSDDCGIDRENVPPISKTVTSPTIMHKGNRGNTTHPAPYKPFLKKDKVSLKTQPWQKASYAKLHKDILKPLQSKTIPKNCWIDLSPQFSKEAKNLKSIRKCQNLFERLTQFPASIELSRSVWMEACRVTRLTELIQRVKVPMSTSNKNRILHSPTLKQNISIKTTASSGVSDWTNQASESNSRTEISWLNHSRTVNNPKVRRSCTPPFSENYTVDLSSPTRPYIQYSKKDELRASDSLYTCSSTKFKEITYAGMHPEQELSTEDFNKSSFNSPSAAKLLVSKKKNMSICNQETKAEQRVPQCYDRRKKLYASDLEQMWVVAMASLRRNNLDAAGIGLLEFYRMIEAMAILLLPHIPSKKDYVGLWVKLNPPTTDEANRTKERCSKEVVKILQELMEKPQGQNKLSECGREEASIGKKKQSFGKEIKENFLLSTACETSGSTKNNSDTLTSHDFEQGKQGFLALHIQPLYHESLSDSEGYACSDKHGSNSQKQIIGAEDTHKLDRYPAAAAMPSNQSQPNADWKHLSPSNMFEISTKDVKCLVNSPSVDRFSTICAQETIPNCSIPPQQTNETALNQSQTPENCYTITQEYFSENSTIKIAPYNELFGKLDKFDEERDTAMCQVPCSKPLSTQVQPQSFNAVSSATEYQHSLVLAENRRRKTYSYNTIETSNLNEKGSMEALKTAISSDSTVSSTASPVSLTDKRANKCQVSRSMTTPVASNKFSCYKAPSCSMRSVSQSNPSDTNGRGRASEVPDWYYGALDAWPNIRSYTQMKIPAKQRLEAVDQFIDFFHVRMSTFGKA